MSFDFATVQLGARAERGFGLPVLHPVTREVTGAVIQLVGRDAPRLVEMENRHQRERARREMRAPGSGLDTLETELLERAVAATLGWQGVDYAGESPYPFSAANAERLYREQKWLLNDVLLAVNERDRLHRD